MPLIGINGKISAGKDTVGMIIQALTSKGAWALDPISYAEGYKGRPNLKGGFQLRKFAGPLKQIASILTGIPVAAFEDQAFKDSYLPSEWDYWTAGPDEMWAGKFTSQRDALMSIANYQGTSIKEVDESVVCRHSLTIRQFLQILGTEGIRNAVHPQSWVNAAFAEYNEGCDWIFTDMRFPNEMQAVLDRGGVTIRVSRPSTTPSQAHASETALDTATFTYEILNDGTLEELVDKVRAVLAEISKTHVILA